MNIRQQKYKKNRLSGMNAYQSAIKAGYSHNTAISAYRNIEKRINFDDILVKHGLDNNTVIKVLGDGLNASKVISCNVVAKDGEGMADANSMTKDFIDVPDYAIRHKYLETFLKLRGDLKDLAPSNSLTVINMPTIQYGEKFLEFHIGQVNPPKAA